MDSGTRRLPLDLAVDLPALLELVRAHGRRSCSSTTGVLAERLAFPDQRAGPGERRRRRSQQAEGGRASTPWLPCREQRVLIEDDLRAGRIPASSRPRAWSSGSTWAPSISSSRSRARRVCGARPPTGQPFRAREPGATSKGRIFPKFRADLLECAVVAKAMREGEIEETAIPANPLDVLAQQVVAICADDEIVDDFYDLVQGVTPSPTSRARSSTTSSTCSPGATSGEFAELRPRIVWDRTAGVIRGRTGARLAVTNAGTIPDQGLFGVFQVDGGGRVGELDEEMVYEAREGGPSCSARRRGASRRSRATASRLPGARCPRRGAVLEGEGSAGHPSSAGGSDRRRAPSSAALSDARDGQAARRVPPRRARGAEPPDLPARAGARERAPDRSHGRGRAVPGRDRRLARVS